MVTTKDVMDLTWSLGEWEEALTINVGSAYACRACGNLVMVTKGGQGVLKLTCCEAPMEKVETCGRKGQ